MQTAMLAPGLRETFPPRYVQQLIWGFDEDLNVENFRQAWLRVFRRHDVFRHEFHISEKGQMEIHRGIRLRVQIRFQDQTKGMDSKRASQLRKFKREDFNRGFAGLKNLCRLTLVQLAESKFQLIWTSHHSLFDGRARLILINEFQDCYRALEEGREPELPSPVEFEDYLGWLDRKSFSKSRIFWKRYLEGLDEPTPLAFGTKEPSRSDRAAVRQTSETLSAKLSRQLHQWSNQSGYSLNLLFQAAWSVYLWRTSGKQTIAFGAARACRKSSIPEAERAVGLFVNTVPVCLRIGQIKTVKALFSSLRQGWLEMRPHEHSPGDLIKEASKFPSREPLFESLIGFEKYRLEDLVQSKEGKSYRFDLRGYTDLPLVIQAYDGKQIELTVSYDSGRFDEPAVQSMLKSLLVIMAQLVDPKTTRLASLSLLDKRSSKAILKQSFGKGRSLSGRSIQAHFSDMVEKFPDRVAVRKGEQQLSYRDLDERSNQWARFLAKQGVVKGSSVGLFFDRDLEMLIAMLAVLKAGAAYVPFDVEYPKDRLKWMLSDVKPELLLSSLGLEPELSQMGLKAIFFEEAEARVRRFSKKAPAPRVEAAAAAYIMYTSGSTGKPKGVVVPHRGITRLVIGSDYVRLSSRTCTLQMAPVSFDAATFEIWAPLLNGGTCVLYPGRMPDLDVIKSEISSMGVNTLWLTASLFNFVIDSAPEILKGIRQLLVGGEALSPPHICKAYNKLPKIQLINGYGPTENTTFSCCYRIPRDQSAKKPVPLGTTIAGSTAYVLDGSRQLLPIGIPGELYVGGRGVALGYFNRKRLTASRFVPDPFSNSPGELMYATGDKVLLNKEGLLEFLGRNDNQVKIRGHRIEPGEVQAHLLNSPGVREVFVKVESIRNENQLIAFVVFRKQNVQNIPQTTSWLKNRVPEYMIPYQFVEIPSMPLTPNGKVNTAALKVPERSVFPKPIIAQGKLTPTQKILRQYWTKILGIAPHSLQESFLNSGGHSMSAINFIFNIRSRFNVELPFCVFEQHDSIEQLAEWIEKISKSGSSGHLGHFEIKPVKVPARNELTRKWKAVYEKVIRKPANGMVICRGFLLEGPLRKHLLQQAINHLIAIHERLRTKGTLIKGKVFEETVPELELKLNFEDLSAMGPVQSLRETERILEEISLGGFNMTKLPLMDLRLLKLKNRKHALIFAIHHSIVDATSLELILNQLGQTYTDLCRGQDPSVPVPRFGYHQYHRAFRGWLKGATKRRLEAYWKKETADLLNYQFPFEKKGVKRVNAKYSVMKNYKFKSHWAERIGEYCMSEGISKYVFLVSNVHALMYRYLNQPMVFNSVPSDTRKTSDEAAIVADMGCGTYIKSYLKPELRFVEVCQQVSAKIFEVMENNILGSPGVGKWAPQDPNSEFRLFNLFNVMSSPESGNSLKLEGIKVTPFERKIRPTQTKFNLVLRETEHDLELALHYPPDLVVKNGIERMFHNLQWFIRMSLENPDKRLEDYPDLRSRRHVRSPLTPVEKKQRLFDTPF